MGSGLILDDTGKKMSKSSTNGVSPIEVIDKYGRDVARLHVHFLAAYEDNTPWTYDGITNFIDKVWNLQNMIKDIEISTEHIYEINNLIKKVTEDIENLKLNTCISAFMTFIKKIKEDKFISREELRIFLVLLNPLAPHITSEMYEMIFKENIIDAEWPKFDENYLIRDEINLPIQINGKIKKTISVSKDAVEDEVIALIKNIYPELIFGEIKKLFTYKEK